MNDSTTRFSNLVADYVRYRPHYPSALISTLENECGLQASHCIADIGCGTGISSKSFIDNGNHVMGVEPNAPMLQAAVDYLQSERFTPIQAHAEQTTLADHSIDFIVAGQAFHWFDQSKCHQEFQRILKPEGKVVLFWNLRDDQNAFMKAYDDLIKAHAIDYEQVGHQRITPEVIQNFFAPNSVKTIVLDNQQQLDWQGLQGRVASVSYMPKADHSNYSALQNALRALFDEFQSHKNVIMTYRLKISIGQL